jgi:hypothetical protein
MTPPAALCAACHGPLYPQLARHRKDGWVHAGPCPLTCPVCGIDFTAANNRGHPIPTCCSRSCAAKLRHNRLGHQNVGRPPRVNCAGCGNKCRSQTGMCSRCTEDLVLAGGRWAKRPGGLRVWVRDNEREAS